MIVVGGGLLGVVGKVVVVGEGDVTDDVVGTDVPLFWVVETIDPLHPVTLVS